MKMKPTHKDFYMEIRKSPGRFLSILFIVALGVAFFSGIRASEPDMRLTGDAYFDESNQNKYNRFRCRAFSPVSYTHSAPCCVNQGKF